MFSNNALKIYQRLDNVLRKDKNASSSELINESIKQEINKLLNTYLEAIPNSSEISIKYDEKEMKLEYSVKIKRLKDFIYC